jgi:hypothetical protein
VFGLKVGLCPAKAFFRCWARRSILAADEALVAEISKFMKNTLCAEFAKVGFRAVGYTGNLNVTDAVKVLS